MVNKVLAYKVRLDGRKIHYRKDKWKQILKSAIIRGLHEHGYDDLTEVISVEEIHEPNVPLKGKPNE